MPNPIRSLIGLALATVFAGATLVAAPSPASAADLSVAQAEARMVDLLNAERAVHGLLPIRVDPRLTAIARQRSADMAAKHYFSHTQPDGRTVFDLIAASGIAWHGAGEIIAWNSWPSLADSAVAARDGWMGSPGHRSIVVSGSYNYLGIGLAIDPSNGRKLWTGVFMKGPDRTGGWVTFQPIPAASLAATTTATTRSVRVRWSGGDVRLVVLTAGLRHYQVQARTDSGAWRWTSRATTSTSRTITVTRGHTYGVRVRACDKAGNCGPWRYQTVHG